jgi:hypothetical protein
MILDRMARIGAMAPVLLLGIAAGTIGVADPARAETREWSFEVLEVTNVGPDTNVIRLRPMPPGEHFPRSCETFVVYSYYDLEGWSGDTRGLAPQAEHERTIQMLLQAQVMNTIVRLRAVGRGFGARPEAPRCEVSSRALNFALDPGGDPVIFSFYQEPESRN